MASWGKKLGVRGKNEKGERKKEENYKKKGEKGLKNASFGNDQNAQYISLRIYLSESAFLWKFGSGYLIFKESLQFPKLIQAFFLIFLFSVSPFLSII